MDLTLIKKIKEAQPFLSKLGCDYMMFSPLLLLSKIGNDKLKYELRNEGILFYYEGGACYFMPLVEDKKEYVKNILSLIKEKKFTEIQCLPSRCVDFLKSRKLVNKVQTQNNEYVCITSGLATMSGKRYRNIRNSVNKIKKNPEYKTVELSEENKSLFLECNSERYRKKKDEFFRLFLKREIDFCINNYKEFSENFNIKCFGVKQGNKIIAFEFGSEISDRFWGIIFQRRSDLENPDVGHYLDHYLSSLYVDYEYENDGGASSKGIKQLKIRMSDFVINSYVAEL